MPSSTERQVAQLVSNSDHLAFQSLQKLEEVADHKIMSRHLHLVPAGQDFDTEVENAPVEVVDTNVVDLESERLRRRYRYHPSAGQQWIDDLFDDDFDPVC